MICVACGEATDSDPCAACGAGALLDGRYRFEEAIGVGAHGSTWRATELATGRVYAVKELPLRRVDSEKTAELFAREARVLRELSHPFIPAYAEDLEAGKGRLRTLYIVQEYIDGPTLLQEMVTRRYTADEVLAIAEELCGILAYLHGLSPPVVHRDLKPGNVMRRRSDGRLVLVDFGAVRDVLKGDLGGSTVAGTFGYMAPEQLVGDASPATDMYALGALCAALLTRREPSSLLDHAHRLRWRDATRVHPAVAALVDHLVEPDPTRRASNVDEVLAELRGLRACIAREGAPAVSAARERQPMWAVLRMPPARPPPAEVAVTEGRAPIRRAAALPPRALRRLLIRIERVRRRLLGGTPW